MQTQTNQDTVVRLLTRKELSERWHLSIETLDARFEWFTSPECQVLLKDKHTPSITAEAGKDERDETHTPCKFFQLADVADERVADGQLKENAPCVGADGPVSDGDAATDAVRGHAPSLLADLVDRLNLDAGHGLFPEGHPDCLWGDAWPEHYYPAQYTSALDYLDGGSKGDEQKVFSRLSSLVHKIEHDAIMGTPLQTNRPSGREWAEGSFPDAFLAAREYVRKEMERRERMLLAA